MHESITMADVGSMVNVMGSRMATPFGPPRPGSTPTKMPSTSPSSIIARIFHVKRTAKPCSRRLTASISRDWRSPPEQRFDRPLRHDHVEREVEGGEHDEHEQEGCQQRLPQ